MNRWRRRTALVTGASSGIGRAIVINLLGHGLNVFACARRLELVRSIKDEVDSSTAGELIPLLCDMSKEEDILAMFETIKSSQFGGIDVCINNAGTANSLSSVIDSEVQDWRNILNVNLLGLAICSKEALKLMKHQGTEDGHIVNFSSFLGSVVWPNTSMYCASKHGVRAFTECLRHELLAEKSKIRVSLIQPGIVKTDMIRYVFGDDAAQDMLKHSEHLLPEDIVSVVEYVLSAPRHMEVNDVLVYPKCRPDKE